MDNSNYPYVGETTNQQVANMAKTLAKWAENPTTNEFYITANGPASAAIKHVKSGRIVYSAPVIYFSNIAKIDIYHNESVVFYTLLQYCTHKVFK